MKEENFQELCESIRQMGKIRRGEMKPGRVTVIEQPPRVQAVRKKLRLSQGQFAALIGVPKTLCKASWLPRPEMKYMSKSWVASLSCGVVILG